MCWRLRGPNLFIAEMILMFSSSSTDIIRWILSKYSSALGMLNGVPKKGKEGLGYYCFHCLPWNAVRTGRRGVTERVEHSIHHEGSRRTLILTYCYAIPLSIKKYHVIWLAIYNYADISRYDERHRLRTGTVVYPLVSQRIEPYQVSF